MVLNCDGAATTAFCSIGADDFLPAKQHDAPCRLVAAAADPAQNSLKCDWGFPRPLEGGKKKQAREPREDK